MAKFTIIEKCEVKRTYEIEAESGEEALEKMYTGEFSPTFEQDDNNEVTVFDENENIVEC